MISNRSDIINYLIGLNGYKRYLEIGVRDNKNFKRITANHKDGVDPAGKCNNVMTSDKFFSTIPKTQMYDIVFIDGLHIKSQALRDISNSLDHLNDNGAIVIHDCNPILKEHAIKKYKGYGTWNGTVWEAFVELRMNRDDLFMCTVKKDTGCGIIKRGKQKTFKKQDICFEFFDKNRKELLNLVTAEEFMEMIGDK